MQRMHSHYINNNTAICILNIHASFEFTKKHRGILATSEDYRLHKLHGREKETEKTY